MNRTRLYLLGLALASCGQPDSQDTARSSGPAPAAVVEPQSSASTTGSQEARANVTPSKAAAKFEKGAEAFATVKDALLRRYYVEGLSEDEIYLAATEGVLEKVDPSMKAWNKLLTPREVAELKNDLRGEVVGVGVQIEFDSKSGHADVTGTLPGSPAEKAGLASGDKIVTVNGKLYKGMSLGDVVGDIRGKAGESVTLSVLRADKLLSFQITRAAVAYDQVEHATFGDVGYVRIPSFTDRTPAAVKGALEALSAKSVKGLVVDLRQCPGGSFDRALDTASLFFAHASPIVSLRKRGKAEERHVASNTAGVLLDVPVAALVDHDTASGAEFIAAALRENRRARLVGERTLGKWSVQSLDELPNGFAFKYTVSLFFTPMGKTYQGSGLAPDIEVTMKGSAISRGRAAPTPQERLALDVQLKTASELLSVK